MPRRFLSKAERQRLSQFPDEVTDADCIVYFTLTPDDQALIGSRRGQENRLGMALLLQQACERLYQLRLVRPAITSMKELVADARQRAEVKSIEVLVNPLPERARKTLDTMNCHPAD